MESSRREARGVTAADLVVIGAPLQLYPGWLPAAPRTITGNCVIHDVGDEVPDHPGGVLLLVGARPGDPLSVPTISAAGAREFACVVVKARGDDLGEVIAAAEAAGVALMVAPDETSWRDVDRLVSAVVDAQGSSTPAYAEVRPGDLFALANAIAYSVGGATSVEDHNGRMFAYSNLPHQKIDDIRLQSITERQTPVREGDAENYLRVRNADKPLYFKSPQPELASRLAVPVRAGDELLGTIWVLDGDPPLRKGARQALEDAATVAALHLLQIRQQEDGRRWNRGEVLSQLLAGRIGPAVASALVGLPATTPTTVLAISAADAEYADETPALGLARTINMINLYCEAWHPRAMATSVDDRIYAVLPAHKASARGRTPAGFAREVCDTVRRTTGVTLRIGVGPTADALEGLAESRRLADMTLAALLRAGDEDAVATIADMRSRVMLDELADGGVLDLSLPGDPLAAIRQHDRERRTTYCESLLAYLDAFGDTASAAKSLNVHENTLRYRIRRLPELFDLDLSDPEIRLVAWLQLRLDRD
ncbi:helix-turn-helix domain-containing protein [Nocardioides hungaricus]